MEFFRIVGLSVVAAIAYGIAHDQVTVRLCVEYFTIGHPRIVATSSPTLLALFWGVAATWWVGLPLGFLLAAAARNGRKYPQLGVTAVVPRVLTLIVSMFVAAGLAGVAIYVSSGPLEIALPKAVAPLVSPVAQRTFLAVWAAHIASYAVGVFGGLIVVLLTFRERMRIGASQPLRLR